MEQVIKFNNEKAPITRIDEVDEGCLYELSGRIGNYFPYGVCESSNWLREQIDEGRLKQSQISVCSQKYLKNQINPKTGAKRE